MSKMVGLRTDHLTGYFQPVRKTDSDNVPTRVLVKLCRKYVSLIAQRRYVCLFTMKFLSNIYTCTNTYTQQKSSAQVGVRVNSVLTRNGCIKYFISLFKEIILQHLDAF